MTPFTLVMAYYGNAGMLREQAWKWLQLPDDIRENLDVVIVDDGTPRPDDAFHALDAAGWIVLKNRLASVQLWRMGVDVRWNQDACRNVGVLRARAAWVLLTDMDHVVPPDTWRHLMQHKLKKKQAYKFGRVNAPDLSPYKPHPNSWAMTKNMYWDAGGYDEALAGNYGTDGDFLVRLRKVAEVVQLTAPLIRYSRDVIADASTTTLQRKNLDDRQRILDLIHGREKIPGWKPLHFSFPCERLL